MGSLEGHGTHLLDEIHKSATKAPGLVPMTLQGVHGHLRGSLVAHRHDVDSIVEQGCISLQRAEAGLRAAAVACTSALPHLPLSYYTFMVSWGREQARRPRGNPGFLPGEASLSGPMSLWIPQCHPLFCRPGSLSPDPLPNSLPNPTDFLLLSCLLSLTPASHNPSPHALFYVIHF